MKMTKKQFDATRQLARAYGHEWAVGLDFTERWPRNVPPERQDTSRGQWSREQARSASEDAPLWRKWCNLHDRIESGYVPTTEEIERLSVPLFESEHFPSTPEVCLRHETCTGRTRWNVLSDGEIRFEFIDDDQLTVLARAAVYWARSGMRVAHVDAVVPAGQWGTGCQPLGSPEPHRDRIVRALEAAGVAHEEALRAVDRCEVPGLPRACNFNLAERACA